MRRLSVVLVLLALCVSLPVVLADSTLDPILKPIALDVDSFTKGVLESQLPWVLVFAESEESEEATALAQSLDAFGRVGVVQPKKKYLLKLLKVEADALPAYRLYPYGPNRTAEGVDYETAEEAKAALLASLPRDTVAVVRAESEMQDVFVSALNEGVVPALLYAEGTEVPAAATKLSLWMRDRYRIVFIPNPSPDVMKQMRIERLPYMQLMVPSAAESGQVGFRGVPYDRAKFGALKFPNLVRFLATAEMELRQNNMWPPAPKKTQTSTPPPSSPSSEPPADIFEVSSATPDACAASKLGLCIVAFLDGEPSNAAARESQLEMLKKVQHLPSNRGRALHFMWVDARCHPGLAAAFDVLLENTPVVVAVSPKKTRFAQMIGVYDVDRISSFIAGVLSGKNAIAPYKDFPVAAASEDCKALYASAPAEPAAPADEFDLSDVLGEDVGPSEREQLTEARVADFAAAEQAAEKIEREEKERRAREEVERLNKMSKKKKKAKSAKPKTEL